MLVDAHAHLDHYQGEALDRALEEIAHLRILTIAVATDTPSYERVARLARRSPLVLPAFGVHPWKAPAYAGRLDALDPLIAASPVLGEIGLDHRFVEDASFYPAQRAVFERFLAGARAHDALVNLHTSGAEAEVLDLLRAHGVRRVIVHWYAGPLNVLCGLLEAGAYFTVGVEVHSSAHIQALAGGIPADRLLTETDNPDGLEWLTGRAGSPRALLGVIRKLAELRGTSDADVRRTVRENLARLLQPDPRLAGLAARLEEDEVPDTKRRI
jgi:TatD DNase family protein